MEVSEMARLGGFARRDSLTAKKRTEIARKAANARWEKAGKSVQRPKAEQALARKGSERR